MTMMSVRAVAAAASASAATAARRRRRPGAPARLTAPAPAPSAPVLSTVASSKAAGISTAQQLPSVSAAGPAACWLWLGRPASAAVDAGHQRMLYHTSTTVNGGAAASADTDGAHSSSDDAVGPEMLLRNLEEVRENGLKPHKRVYHRTLKAVMDAHPDGAMPEQARVLLGWMASDYGRRLSSTTFSLLLQRCKTKDQLLSLLADVSRAKHKSSGLAVDVINAYLRTVRHLNSVGLPRQAAAGDTAKAVVSLLKEMHFAGVRLDGVPALKLLQHLVDVKLLQSAEDFYRMLTETLNRTIMIDLIKLCATDRTERRLFRQSLHRLQTEAQDSPEGDPTRYWSGSELRRREEYRQDVGPGFKACRFATQLWMEIEKGYPSQKSFPTVLAHKAFLLATCKRGDLRLMRQVHTLLATRYPEVGASAEVRSLLLKGCVVAGSPGEALAYMDWFDVDATAADCELLFQTARTLSGYRYLSALVTRCSLVLNETGEFATMKVRLKWLDDLLLASCSKIVQHEDRRRRNEFTALPVPLAETLVPFEDQEKLTSVVQLRAKPGSDLTPKISLADLINDEKKALAEQFFKKEVRAWTQSPLLKQMKRDRVPHLSSDLRWDWSSDGSEDYGAKGRPRATLATPEATRIVDDDDDFDDFEEANAGLQDGSTGFPAAAEFTVGIPAETEEEFVEDTTDYFAASGIPSDGEGGQKALRPTPATAGGVSIALGRRASKYLVLTRRGKSGGKYSPHLFALTRPVECVHGHFYFANGESFSTINEAMLRYSLSSTAEECTELGCLFHPPKTE